jgi:hypothetical protein
MEKDAKEFLEVTSKKLANIEKKIQEMKLNIVIMSFYSDIKLIEETILSYEAQGFEVNKTLVDKVEKFKSLLKNDKNLPKLGKKFIELTDEFHKLRNQIYTTDITGETEEPTDSESSKEAIKKAVLDFLSAYA